MADLPLTGHDLHNAKLEYHGKFGHTLGRIQHIYLMSRIDICYTTCHLKTQTVLPTLPGFQGIKRCVKYLYSHPRKPIFYHLNSYESSNVTRVTWSGNQVENYTTRNGLECHQDLDHSRILNIIQSVLVILHNLLGVAIC